MFDRIVKAQPDLVVLANLSTSVGGAAAWEQGLGGILSRLGKRKGLAVAVMRDTPRVPVRRADVRSARTVARPGYQRGVSIPSGRPPALA